MACKEELISHKARQKYFSRHRQSSLNSIGSLRSGPFFFSQSVKICEATYGAESANAAAANLQLAVLLQKKKSYQESAELAVHALKINDVALGTVHPTTIQNLTFLRDLSKQARDRDAWEQYYKALKERREQQNTAVVATDGMAVPEE
jgi:hypothetical protein